MSDLASDPEIVRIREELVKMDQASHTSLKFQNDLLTFIEKNHAKGQSLIEVGCYKGGLTAQIAYAAKKFGLSFDVIDIDHAFINISANAIERVGLTGYVNFHAMDLASFVKNSPNYGTPALVFVDGDHQYDGVVADIRAIKAFPKTPYACAFHDFSLRYADGNLANVRVDLALYDEFGSDAPLVPIGEIAGDGQLRTQPGEDRHFHEIGKSEGVIIVL